MKSQHRAITFKPYTKTNIDCALYMDLFLFTNITNLICLTFSPSLISGQQIWSDPLPTAEWIISPQRCVNMLCKRSP